MAGRPDAGVPAALHRPPAGDLALMAVGVAAVSTSGPLIAATAAPALAIAFWRNAFAAGVLAPLSLVVAARELVAMTRREWVLAAAAGVLLGAHFATWVPSVTMTSVAASTALVTTQPIWVALLARLRGHEVPAAAWIGIAVAVAGAAIVTGADISVSARALAGDGLAVVGAVMAAGYVTLGGEVRRTVSTVSYTAVCYSVTAAMLVVCCAVAGARLSGYSGEAWLKIAALTLGAQFLGHTVFNRVLRTTSPTVVSLAILFEAPGASLIAGLWLDQRPAALTFVGLAVLLSGIAVVVRSGAGSPALPVE